MNIREVVGAMNTIHRSPLLLSLDRDDTDEEDYERYCVTRFAAELEEEADNQDKEERKIAKVDKRAVTTF